MKYKISCSVALIVVGWLCIQVLMANATPRSWEEKNRKVEQGHIASKRSAESFVKNAYYDINNIPPDWRQGVLDGNLLFAVNDPPELYRMASIGNGYVATIVNSPDMYVSGVFNGATSKSIRARIPATTAIDVAGSVPYASALDLKKGVFYKRSTFQNCLSCAFVSIEQRWYAHRALPSLVVHELEVMINQSSPQQSVVMDLFNNSGTPSSDINFQWLNPQVAGSVLSSGKTLVPEEPTTPLTQVAVCASAIPDSITLNTADTYPHTYYFVSAIRTSHDAQDPVQAAIADYTKAQSNLPNLLSLHIKAWDEVWQSGIEVEGRLELAQAINSSFYYVLSSIRPTDTDNKDFPFSAYSLSPGSLATTGYAGHTFWDAETWMYPPLLVFHPDLARNVLDYRMLRVAGAVAKAKRNKYQGTMFPWESAYTGDEVCPYPPDAHKEQHITADIGLSLQQYWRTHKDLDWLRSNGYVMIRSIANYWTSRVTFNSSNGKYGIMGVIGPDEYAEGPNNEGINNNGYTNAIAAACLQFAIEAAKALGVSYPQTWQTISDNMYVPFDPSLNYHPEYDGYKLKQIVKQADTVLLGYPILYSMPAQVRRNDLQYYLGVTDINGPAMTWGMFSLGFLELKDFNRAAQFFNQSYQLNINLPYFAWMETPTGGCSHFITGAGGFLQGVYAGYGGMRILDNSLSFDPVLPEGVTSMRFRNLHYLGNRVDIFFNTTSTVFEIMTRSSGASLLAVTDSFGRTIRLALEVPITIQRTGKAISLGPVSSSF